MALSSDRMPAVERLEQPPAAASGDRSLSADTALMFVATSVVGVASFTSTVIVARTVGPEGQGTVAVAVSLALILILTGSLGLVTSNPAMAARDRSAIPALRANTLWLGAGIGAIIVAAGLLVRLLVPDILPTLDPLEYVLVLVVVPFALGGQLVRSILLGVGRTTAYNGAEVALSLFTLVAVTVGIAILGGGVTTAIVLLLAQYPVGLAVYSVLTSRGVGWSLRPDLAVARSMLSLGLRVYPATVLAYFLVKLDVLLVAGILGSRDAGFYSAALVIAQGLYLFPMVVGLSFFPRVAQSEGNARTAEVFRTTALFYAAACFLVVAAAPVLVPVLSGREFKDAVVLLLCLVPGTFCLGMVAIFSYHFAGREYPPALIAFWAGALALNIAINVLLLPIYGVVVAPLASSVAYAAVLVLHARLFARMSGGWDTLRPRPREAITTVVRVYRRVRSRHI
jgi:O-antigen/teichoic acid export membrane protein